TFTTDGHLTWTLGNLTGLTTAEGAYALTLPAAGSGLRDNRGDGLAADASSTWVVDTTPPTATIVAASSPRVAAVDALTITFNEPVTGLDVAALQLVN